MSVLTDFLELLDGLLGSAAYFPIVLLGAGVFFTFYLGFPQIRFFKHAWGSYLGVTPKKRTQVTPVTSSLVDSAVWNRWYRQHWRRGIRYFSGRARRFVLDVGNRFSWDDHKVCRGIYQP